MIKKLKLICLLALWSSFCRAQSITSVEYFIDTDPGVGLANSLAIGMASDTININTSISLTGYAAGFHYIYVRTKNTLGVWNVIEQRPFYISSPALNTYSANTNIEYFIDTDPGVGLATDLPIADGDTLKAIASIPLTGIPSGLHNLYVRTKTSAGLWNVIEQRPFYISNPPLNTYSANTNIEYFIDTDPGVGLATDLPIADGDTLNAVASIPLTGIPAGFHNLYVRTKTSVGLWNVIEQRPFYINNPALSNVTEINKIEYFFDNDPGVGLATNLPILTPPNDSVTISSNIVVPCLANGMHFMWIRAKNNLGVWNVVEYDTLNVGGSMFTQPIVFNGPDTVCFPATVNMKADSAAGITYQWLDNGVPISGATFAKYVATVSGSYSLQQTCNASIVTSNVLIAIVNYLPQITFCPPLVTVNAPINLCSSVVNYPNATATGSVPLPVITYSQNSGTVFSIDTTVVKVYATNMCGIDSCKFNVVVNDVQNPDITCQPDTFVPCDPLSLMTCDVTLLSPSVSDNCGIATTINNAPACFSVGPTTVTWTTTDVHGNINTCNQSVTGYVPVDLASNILIQGYYTGGGLMNNGGLGGCLFLSGASANPLDADTIYVNAMNANSPYDEVDRKPGILKTNGDITVNFGPAVVANTSYYLKINHRNSVETWSKNPVLLTPTTSYSFSSNASQAFDDNEVATFDNFGFAIYSGDINQDGSIDATDFLELDPSIQNGDGGYLVGDLNGDGSVDASDFLILDPNIQNGIGAAYPTP